ncbi:protein LURP-one-related 12-like [Vicia villosa]|uniref:protein LURP-one-related 12-like n=1 Tax=Vicia villosa TaxID=3911 RepID=UPI00273CD378|nr:protein LURP-one-related 12-like [Vicia villosa]
MNNEELVIQDEYVYKEETRLTVLKTSRFFTGDGFVVYDCKGQLVFRFDSYGPNTRDKEELVLMNPHGRSLLTLRKKKISLHRRWEGFKDDKKKGDKPIFDVRRLSIIGRSQTNVIVEIHDIPSMVYLIEGCFSQRSCKIFDTRKKLVAEIRRKVDPATSVMLGKEVFLLCVQPDFDVSFIMGLILVLDQISDKNVFDNEIIETPVHPIIED